MNDNHFYMLVVEGGNSPRKEHRTLIDAQNEAIRLARLTHQRVTILCSIKSIELNEFKITDLRPNNELPF